MDKQLHINNIITQNVHNIKKKINNIAEKCRKDPKNISFIAVSKNQSINAIWSAISAGQRDFGENYIQESIKKILYFKNNINNKKIIWHFIGHIQSNKIKLIAKYFDWCHTLTTENLAQKLNKERQNTATPLNVLIQVNINKNNHKSGILPQQLQILIKKITLFPKLKLRGLMAIPNLENNYYKQLESFVQIKQLFQEFKQKYQTIDTLSIGMSNDISAAIASDGNLLRIGTAIFGYRIKRNYIK